jgi:hypothetical protein
MNSFSLCFIVSVSLLLSIQIDCFKVSRITSTKYSRCSRSLHTKLNEKIKNEKNTFMDVLSGKAAVRAEKASNPALFKSPSAKNIPNRLELS